MSGVTAEIMNMSENENEENRFCNNPKKGK